MATRNRNAPARALSATALPSLNLALANVIHRLEVAQAVAYTASDALRHQAADADNEIALILRRCVGDELSRQIEYLTAVLDRPPVHLKGGSPVRAK